MKLPETICYWLNRPKNKAAIGLSKIDSINQSKSVNEYQKQFALTEEKKNKYLTQSGSFYRRYQNRLRSYQYFPNLNCFLIGKTVLDLGSGRGEGVLNLIADRKASFVYGVDTDDERCKFACEMLKDHGITNAKIINANAGKLPEIPDQSLDAIVSIDVFEHIFNLNEVLKEARRMLKQGGYLYAEFAPIWRNYYGSHLARELPFPWTHLIFSEKTVKSTLSRINNRSYADIKLYTGLNKLRLKDYQNIFAESGFQVTFMKNVTTSFIKQTLIKFPILDELVSGSIVVLLKNP